MMTDERQTKLRIDRLQAKFFSEWQQFIWHKLFETSDKISARILLKIYDSFDFVVSAAYKPSQPDFFQPRAVGACINMLRFVYFAWYNLPS